MGQFDNLKGRLIMFDGPDYVGKTTQLKLAKQAVEDDGLAVFTARSNGGSPIGEALRTVILGDYDRPAISELYINLAQHYALAEPLKAERTKGSVVLVDRSPLSIMAYQVYGSGLDPTKGAQAVEEILDLHKPDLIICYQAPANILADRRDRQQHDVDFFELQPETFFNRVAEGYRQAIKLYRPTVIEASGSIDEIHNATMAALSGLA